MGKDLLTFTQTTLQKMGLKVGITGGIGSGKTTVCGIFELFGVPVYYADQRAKDLMVTDEELRRKISDLLGSQAYTSDGQLNRQWVANTVFGRPDLLRQLNSMVHPAVAKDSQQWHNTHQDAPYTLKEAALLYESGNYLALDYMIEVFAPRQLRIQRVMERDSVSEEQVEARMKSQWPEWKKLIHADAVIVNDGRQSLIAQVAQTHKHLQRHHNL